MKKIKIISVILLMLIIISGCNKEQKGNMMKLELNCDAENGYVWQTTVLNSNVISVAVSILQEIKFINTEEIIL